MTDGHKIILFIHFLFILLTLAYIIMLGMRGLFYKSEHVLPLVFLTLVSTVTVFLLLLIALQSSIVNGLVWVPGCGLWIYNIVKITKHYKTL